MVCAVDFMVHLHNRIPLIRERDLDDTSFDLGG
jgi:hypothetical protein